MKRKLRLYIFIICTLTLTISVEAQKYTFIQDQPESVGFSSKSLDTLSTFLEGAGSSACMLVVDGKLIYEWGQVGYKHTIHSIRKPLMNALYGIFVERGVIDTTATLNDLGIDDISPALTDNEKSARVIDLLKSRSGIYHDAAANSSGMISNRPDRDQFKPNEAYFYNNWDFNVLGAILEKATGKSIYELFKTEIADPLGMNDYEGKYVEIDGDDENSEIPKTDGFYQFERSKSKYPAYHFRLSARDMALFGQLYMNEGSWNGEQIIPKSWIDVSTKAYSVTNPGYGIGYGMLWFVLMKNEFRETTSFYHTGNQVHMLGVYPNAKVVLVHRVDTEKEYKFHEGNFYQMIDLVWKARMD